MTINQELPICLPLASLSDDAGGGTRQTLPMQGLFTGTREWPSDIEVEPTRLAHGIWGDSQGDINSAYSADVFPMVKAFSHEGQPFTNGGGTEYFASCYPLLFWDGTTTAEKKPYSYEGAIVTYEKQKFILGSKVCFVSRPLTVPEEVNLLRRKFAFGGLFAAGKTYREMLLEFAEHGGNSEAHKMAIEQELAQEDQPLTRSEMRHRIANASGRLKGDQQTVAIEQPTLPGF